MFSNNNNFKFRHDFSALLNANRLGASASAFTMAEAIIVMIILGIIATIMITNLKPAEFRDKGLKVLAKKTIHQIDEATSQILLNDSFDGTMKTLYVPGNKNERFEFGENYAYTLALYKKYLTITRKEYQESTAPETINNMVSKSSSVASVASPLYLKDGAIIYLGTGEAQGVSLGASSTFTLDSCSMSKNLAGVITVDINGNEEPNLPYKDQFHIPIGLTGVDYEQFCQEAMKIGGCINPAFCQ